MARVPAPSFHRRCQHHDARDGDWLADAVVKPLTGLVVKAIDAGTAPGVCRRCRTGAESEPSPM